MTKSLIIGVVLAFPAASATFQASVCVYGGTSGGVVAAVQVSASGKAAVIFEPGEHAGGMSSGGLGWTDFANKAAIGGLARDFYRQVGKQYNKPEEFNLEPHVAEKIFDDMTHKPGVSIHYRERLARVEKRGAVITAMVSETGDRCQAPMFIDASYEGDLMAKAAVTYTVGRESNTQYGETLNGIQGASVDPRSGKFEIAVDPYIKKGDPGSGVLPYLLRAESLGAIGSADKRIQAYNYRLCLTDRASNRIALAPPADYDDAQFELLARFIEARTAVGEQLHLTDFLKYDPLPNGKWDFNNRWPISTDFIGGSENYPEASWREREEICKRHEDYLRGFLHFLSTNPRVPQTVREETSRFGLTKDEFVKTGGWPHQIYVRESRRMVSDFVMTEHHARGEMVAPHAVGLAAYGIDMHATRRIVVNGKPLNEGSNGGKVPGPYPIAYESIVPRKQECPNLLVTFCLSASHVGFGSIRMEPVFMVLSQSAAIAAMLAIEDGAAVQDVDYAKLQLRLTAAGQVLSWTGARN